MHFKNSVTSTEDVANFKLLISLILFVKLFAVMFNFSPYLFKVAIEKMDEKLRDKVNILNNLRYKTVKQQKRLEELCTQYDQMQKDSSDAMATDAGDSDDAQRLRNLENRLDKARLKCQEAEHIRKTYEQIKAKLGEEHKTFENTLDVMEQKIMK